MNLFLARAVLATALVILDEESLVKGFARPAMAHNAKMAVRSGENLGADATMMFWNLIRRWQHGNLAVVLTEAFR